MPRQHWSDHGTVVLDANGNGHIDLAKSPPANADVWVEHVAVTTSTDGANPMAPGSGPVPYVAVYSGPSPIPVHFQGGTHTGDLDTGHGLIRVLEGDFLHVYFYAGPAGATAAAVATGYQDLLV